MMPIFLKFFKESCWTVRYDLNNLDISPRWHPGERTRHWRCDVTTPFQNDNLKAASEIKPQDVMTSIQSEIISFSRTSEPI